MSLYTLRAAQVDDLPFIYNSWLKSHREASPWAKIIPSTLYYNHHKQLITKILERSDVIVCCNPQDTSQIFGYAAFSQGKIATIHYIYVKHPYRKLGIAKIMFDIIMVNHDQTFPAVATHATGVWLDVLKDKWKMVYNPYLLEAFYE